MTQETLTIKTSEVLDKIVLKLKVYYTVYINIPAALMTSNYERGNGLSQRLHKASLSFLFLFLILAASARGFALNHL